jgi:hypothetical protein
MLVQGQQILGTMCSNEVSSFGSYFFKDKRSLGARFMELSTLTVSI